MLLLFGYLMVVKGKKRFLKVNNKHPNGSLEIKNLTKMRSLKATLLIFGFTLLFSCSKEEVSIPVDIVSFANLEVGNYWVYDWYKISEMGEELIHSNDTIFILEETIISGKKYFIKSSHKYGAGTTMIYDSVQSLFSYTGKNIIFSLDENQKQTIDFGDESNTLATGTYQLNPLKENINVPAGSFECVNWQGTIISKDEDYEYGTRYNNNYYSENIGQVQIRIQFYNSPNELGARLTKFGQLSQD